MPQSRKRPGHHYQHPSDIPASQRTKARIIWAILFGVFALLVAYFVADGNVTVLVIAAALGSVIGYLIGKRSEKMK
jgi:hypothetical protein